MNKLAERYTDFYVVGGTLMPDAPSYIERDADRDLYERTLSCDFCYVLASRQTGKSSLMARTAVRLKKEGIRTAIVDLAQIGAEQEEKSADRWYYGIAHRIVRELEFKIKLPHWWEEREKLLALQRLTEFFGDVVLKNTKEKVVIFVDEIDTTIGLPFTDDFFAAIRACHNARATQPQFKRLSFVLLGVATPSQLIKDTRRTPFNIGHRIELTDFTFQEAWPLAHFPGADRGQGENILKRILYWSGGHPYLTQKLCRIAADEEIENYNDESIDGLVEKHFLEPDSRREDSNLNFVRDRMVQDKTLSRKLLKLYRRILKGRSIPDKPLSSIHSILKLSGVVVPRENRQLSVRNLIYKRIFTRDWVKDVMPTNWNRNIAVASIGILFFGFVVWYTQFLPREHIEAIRRAKDDVPLSSYEKLRKIPGFSGKAEDFFAGYWNRRALSAEAQRKKDHAFLYHLKALKVKPTKYRRRETNRRNYYKKLIATHYYAKQDKAKQDKVVALSPDRRKMLIVYDDGAAWSWEPNNFKQLGNFAKEDASVLAVGFNVDGKSVLTASADGTVWRWDANKLEQLIRYESKVTAASFSPDGKIVIFGLKKASSSPQYDKPKPAYNKKEHDSKLSHKFSGGYGKKMPKYSDDWSARLWFVDTGKPLGKPMKHNSTIHVVAFSPDGKTVVTGNHNGIVRLWRVNTGESLGKSMNHDDEVHAAAFSPDGKTLVTGSHSGSAKLWSVDTGESLGKPMNHGDEVHAVAFTPDGKTVLTGNHKGLVWMWSVDEGEPPYEPIQYDSQTQFIAFTPDGKKVITRSDDGITRLWRPDAVAIKDKIIKHKSNINSIVFSPDGRTVLTGNSESAKLWSVDTGENLGEPMEHNGKVLAVAFSPNGKLVLTGSDDKTAQLWQADTGKQMGAPLEHDSPVRGVAFSPNGQYLLTQEYNKVYLWKIYSDHSTKFEWREKLNYYVGAATFGLDGTFVLTGGDTGMLQMWHSDRSESFRFTITQEKSIGSVNLSSDGATILTSSHDGAINLICAHTSKHLGKLINYYKQIKTTALSPTGRTVMVATDRWIYQAAISDNKIVPKVSHLLPGKWTGAYRFLDDKGDRMQVAVHITGDSIKIINVRFDIPDAPPIEGDPAILLEEWQKKLALKLDEVTGKIEPMYPVEVPERRPGEDLERRKAQ